MLPASHYRAARRAAAIHAQFSIEHMGPIARTPGYVSVQARALHVFRGGKLLSAGDTVEFGVPVTQPGDEIPFSGTIWNALETLRDSPVIEAYLDGAPPRCSVALSQLSLLEASTPYPVMKPA